MRRVHGHGRAELPIIFWKIFAIFLVHHFSLAAITAYDITDLHFIQA